MQPDSKQQYSRSRKYDTYVSGNTSASQNILPNSINYQPQQPVLQTQEPVQQVSNQVPVFQNPITTPSLSNGTYTPPKTYSKKNRSKKPALAAIMKATVQLEKVTKNSISVVKQTFEPDEINAIRTKRQRIFARTSYAIGLASFLVVVGVGAKIIFGNGTSPLSRGVLGAQTTGRISNDPIEQKPSEQDIKTYLVAPLYPRYIRIPKLGLDARVRRLGIDSKGAVAYPTNIFDIGWYDGSVKPGDAEGSAILFGHIMGNTQQGALWNIDTLAAGDTISIEKGNGVVVNYRVTKLYKAQPEDDLSTFLSPEVAGKHDLKLLTTTGMYDKVSGEAKQRTVIYATAI